MSTNKRNDENEDDNESSSNLSNDSQPEEEEKAWEIENIFNFDMSTCSIPNVQHVCALNYALTSVKEAFYEKYEEAFNELHQVNLSANINGTNQYSTEYNKKFPNPFREMENVVKTLAKYAIEAYPLIDNDTKSGLFLQEEQATAAGGGSKSSIANNAITVNTNHDTPSLTTCTDSAFRTFLSAITVLHNSDVPCHIHQWMSNTEVRTFFYWNMFTNGLVKSQSQYESILKSPSRFIAMGESYMRAISLPVGERSVADTIRSRLKFTINDVLSDKESRETIAAFSKFGEENAEIVKNITGTDQTQLVKALIETNLQGTQPAAQKYLFSYLKDLPATKKPKTILNAFQKLMEKLMSTKTSCKEAYAVGYRFTEQQLPDDKHYGGEGANQQLLANKHTSKRKELAGNSSTDDNPSPKKKLNHSSSTCKGCGIEGHNKDACGKTKAAFYNSGPTDYDKSPAWADVIKEHPRIEEIIKKPRIPSGFHLKELSLLTGQTVSKRGK